MSTKQTTNSTSSNALQYDPGSKGLYSSLTGAGGNVLSQYMNNPFGNAFFNIGAGQTQRGAQQGGQNLMQSLMQNIKTSGISGTAGQGFQQAQQGRIGRATQAMSAQGNTQNILAALTRQMQATGMGMSFQPLLTGEKGAQNTTQQTSGLGTWLPQLLSTAAGAAMGGFGGMAGAGGGAGGIFGATQAMPSSQWGGASTGASMYPGFGGMNVAQPPPPSMANLAMFGGV